jgi:hypothetical protein
MRSDVFIKLIFGHTTRTHEIIAAQSIASKQQQQQQQQQHTLSSWSNAHDHWAQHRHWCVLNTPRDMSKPDLL